MHWEAPELSEKGPRMEMRQRAEEGGCWVYGTCIGKINNTMKVREGKNQLSSFGSVSWPRCKSNISPSLMYQSYKHLFWAERILCWVCTRHANGKDWHLTVIILLILGGRERMSLIPEFHLPPEYCMWATVGMQSQKVDITAKRSQIHISQLSDAA